MRRRPYGYNTLNTIQTMHNLMTIPKRLLAKRPFGRVGCNPNSSAHTPRPVIHVRVSQPFPNPHYTTNQLRLQDAAMSLRRLLGLSAAAAAGRLRRRSLATAATHPSWAIIKRNSLAAYDGMAPVLLYDPPRVSDVRPPMHLVNTSGTLDPESGVIQLFPGSVCAASGDGLLLLSYFEVRLSSPLLRAKYREKPATVVDPGYVPDKRFVCNPVTGEMFRLPDIVSGGHVREAMCDKHMGLLTRADRGHDGPPDRFAVAELQGDQMVRFLSGTEGWESVPVSPCQLPHARQMVLDQEVVAFGGRLWWLDVTCGAISADPFSDRPELRFVELPKNSVLSAAAQDRCGCARPHGCGRSTHRRLCVSDGRLWYMELSPEEPFRLSVFALDDEGSGWTLENRLDLSGYQGMARHLPSLQVGFLDPLKANRMYLSARITPQTQDTPGSSVVLAVDMNRDDQILSYPCIWADPSFVPCAFPPWLGSTHIPSAGLVTLSYSWFTTSHF
ncbi:hypothetical protein ACQ4PT_069703 [Festuca glaucescens]